MLDKITPPIVIKKAIPTLEVWPPTKIKYAYNEKNYKDGGGNLNASCMRHSSMQRSCNFYEKQGVQIIVVVNEHKKIYGRALLWSDIKYRGKKGTFTYMDRVYSISSKYDKQFYELALKNKWSVYGYSSAGMEHDGWYVDNLDLEGITHTPYTDTFRSLYYKDKIITSGFTPKRIKHKKHVISFTTTSNRGYRRELDPNSVQEVFTGQYVSKKDCTKIKKYDGYVTKSNIIDIGGEYYSKHDDKLIKSDIDGYILKTDSVVEIITEFGVSKKNCIKSIDPKGYIHKKHVVKLKGIAYHRQSPKVTRYKKKWYHTSQCYKAKDDKLIPKHHAMIVYTLKECEITGKVIWVEEYKPNDYLCDKIIIKEKNYNTIAHLIVDTETRKFIKKYNNKWYLKSQFKKPDKNQMMFDFMKKETVK